MTNRTIPLAEVRADLSRILDEVDRTHERITVTRNGRPVAVVMSPDDLESLEETLDILSDPNALAEIRAAERDIDEGKGIGIEELVARYLPHRKA